MTSGFKSMKRCIIAPASTAEREKKKKGGKEKKSNQLQALLHCVNCIARIGKG